MAEPLSQVERTLRQLAVNPEEVDGATLEQLTAIEAAVSCELEIRRDAEKALARHTLSTASVAHGAGLSRSTVYAKPLLADYIEQRRKDAGLSEGPTVRVPKRRIKELEETIAALKRRDGELVQTKLDLAAAQRRISLHEKAAESQPRTREPGSVIRFREGGPGGARIP